MAGSNWADMKLHAAACLRTCGLVMRGAFNFTAEDAAPPGAAGAPARSVLLIGNAGAAYWPHFKVWRSAQPTGLAHPLDTWCRSILGALADELGARAVSPSDRPYLPFQTWAMRAEGLRPSPLGILMHPQYGPWHAYRGALLLDVEVTEPNCVRPRHACDDCLHQPCRSACPVGAHSGHSFRYDACLDLVTSPVGGRCRGSGCLDRNACPVGQEFRYTDEMQAFHMAAFAA